MVGTERENFGNLKSLDQALPGKACDRMPWHTSTLGKACTKSHAFP